jgi:dTDP-4-amino-4,6-dideoxygalactose transaminase
MTYVPADPLLDPADLLAAGKKLAAGPAAAPGSGLPTDGLFFEWGRVALWAALRALRLRRGDRLLVPAYICDSILPALTAVGVRPHFIPTDRSLRLDLAWLERELDAGAGGVLLVHYFGFPAPQLEAVTAACAQYGVPLLEDCAHALYSQVDGEPLGRRGVAALFSPWKSLPLPDGGMLVLNGESPPADLCQLRRPPLPLTARRVAYRSLGVVETALGRSPRLWLLRSWTLRRRMQAGLAEAALVPRRSSSLAERLARRTDWSTVVARRRANYDLLHQALRDSSWARPLLGELPAGVSPLGYPLLAEHREQKRSALLAAGVNVRAYWEQLPGDVSVEAFGDAHYLADRILVLPVHQSLTPSQLDHLLDVLARLEQA